MSLVRKCLGTLAVIAVVFGVAAHLTASAQETGRLKVTVEYKGPGTVDAAHQIIVWAFDTPDIDANSQPLGSDVVTTNGGSVSFSGLPKTVYLAAAFNEKGTYDGTGGPPPSGTPVTIYGGAGTATPVDTTGADAAVTVTFDDSMRMP